MGTGWHFGFELWDDRLLILPLIENTLEEGIGNLWGVTENSNENIISSAEHLDINTTFLISVLEDGTMNTSFGAGMYFLHLKDTMLKLIKN